MAYTSVSRLSRLSGYGNRALDASTGLEAVPFALALVDDIVIVELAGPLVAGTLASTTGSMSISDFRAKGGDIYDLWIATSVSPRPVCISISVSRTS